VAKLARVQIDQWVSRAEEGLGRGVDDDRLSSAVHYWNAAATVSLLRERCWCSCPEASCLMMSARAKKQIAFLVSVPAIAVE
jgi:hypothetical protein